MQYLRCEERHLHQVLEDLCYLLLKDFFFFFLNQDWGEGCELYFLPSFQLVDYSFFCICGLGGLMCGFDCV